MTTAVTLKPWRENAIPHDDVLKGSFQQAEFAADLSRVHDGTATPEYQDPALFFERTFITEGMRLLLNSVVRRLVGQGGDPVIQLQTAFGGGKTHTMLAVYHLANGKVAASQLHGVSAILDAAGVNELPTARIAVIDGIKVTPNQPQVRGDVTVNTVWGELAWQLGGTEGYQLVAQADQSGTSPGKEVLTDLLTRYAPCVILMDEMVAYLRQFDGSKSYSGGTFDSNLTFIQALTEALKAVPNAMLLASLPESKLEVGSSRGEAALDALEKYFGRVQALWKPVATEEAFEIVRRRLFTRTSDAATAEAVCRAFADYYIANSNDFPNETAESRYYDRLRNAYPIHPEIFDRLYEDWSSLDKFQRTRGVLKLMAKVIHRLWKDDNKDLLIMPGSLPLYEADVRNEAIYYLPQGWDPVLERDIDGEKAETTTIDSDTRFGAVQAARRTARTIFLGSAPSVADQRVRGIEIERICLGCAQPGQTLGVYKDALKRLTDRLHYLNGAGNRFWFDTRPNLRREMEERKRRFSENDHVIPSIRDRVRGMVRSPGVFGGVHVFTPSADVPDDDALRLVVLPPAASYDKTGPSAAVDEAGKLLVSHGEKPRLRQNRLIFLAADYDALSRLKDQVRSQLAWASILEDYNTGKLNLDKHQSAQTAKAEDDARKALEVMLRETYKWVLVPMQESRPGKGISETKWEIGSISTSAPSVAQAVETKLKENEHIITAWSPIHLRNVLAAWFWKDGASTVGARKVWQAMAQYLYLPRLVKEDVFRDTLSAGAASADFFGVAYGEEQVDGKPTYVGFSFGKPIVPMLDDTFLLIEPSVAKAYMDAIEQEKKANDEKNATDVTGKNGTPEVSKPGIVVGPEKKDEPVAKTIKRRFYATASIDPLKAKVRFSDIIDEVVQQFVARHDATVSITVELNAESAKGFDEALQRAVRENCVALKFTSAEFEES